MKKSKYDEIDEEELHHFKGKVVTIKNIEETNYGTLLDFEEYGLQGWDKEYFKPYIK